MSWFSGKRKISRVPYEFLFRTGEFTSKECFAELFRRLRTTVYYIVKNSRASPEAAASATTDIFLEFAAQFPGVPPELGMRRLARILKDAVGEEAFQALYFYAQIPIFYMRNPVEQAILKRYYETGGTITEVQLAEEMQLSASEVPSVLEAANRSFREVLQQLPKDELGLMTDGVLP